MREDKNFEWKGKELEPFTEKGILSFGRGVIPKTDADWHGETGGEEYEKSQA